MNYKKSLTLNEQIEYLKNNKNISFNVIREQEAGRFLLSKNYINVISPFKYQFADKDANGNLIRDKNNKYIYSTNIEFSEYERKYNDERSLYSKLFNKISIFETTFNAVLSYYVLIHFNICSYDDFILLVNSLIKNAKLEKYNPELTEHMINKTMHFVDEFKIYDNPYIFLDRLNLSELITLYRLLDNSIKVEIFKSLKDLNGTIGYPNMKQFDDALSRIVSIRNCICHNNSLTILIRFYRITDKQLRTDSDKKKYNNLIKHLLNS